MARKKAAPRRRVKKTAGRKSRASRSRASRSKASRSNRKAAGVRKAARKPAPKKATRRPTGGPPKAKAAAARRKTRQRAAASRRSARPAAPSPAKTAGRPAPPRTPRLERQRRVLREDREEHGVPSSLDLNRRGSAAGTGREELNQRRRDHATMSPGITAGDVDASVPNAYFSGDEAPGGDTPTPDQDVVDEIGQALGIQYQDNEELKGGEEVTERDRHRWEFDPASAEDYRERNRDK